MTPNITTPKFFPSEIKAEDLTLDEYQIICDRLSRQPHTA
jgi:phosphoribosylformylglycinamidine synthase